MTELACPNGHAVLEGGARFCLQCGQPLVPSGPAFQCAVHPDRRAKLPCPRCGTFACTECLTLLPDGTELCLTCVAREQDSLPWDRREKIGTLRAYWQTSMRILRQPSLTFATARPTGTVGDSLWFSTLATLTASVSTLGLYGMMVVGMVLAITVGDSEEGPQAEGALIAVGVFLGLFILTLGVGIGYVLLNAGLDHLVLRMMGTRPKAFAVTFRASALSLAPALVGLVPFCGYYGFMVWALVVRVFAYRAFHQLPTNKAVIGALAVPGALLLIFMVLYAAMIAWTQSMAAGV